MKKIDVRKSILFLAVSSFLLCLFVVVQVVRADSWLWSSGVPIVVDKRDANLDMSWIDQCQSKFNSVKMEVNLDGTDRSDPQKTDCLVGEGTNFKLLSFSNARGLAVKFGDDVNAHLIQGIDCERCIYMPSRDTLITLESNNQIRTGRVAMYKNFVRKLQLKNTLTLNQRYYQFSQTLPDQLISDFYSSDKYNDYLKAIGRSSNDKWLVVEYVGDGLFRIDMDTMQMLKFSDFRSQYWSSNPGIEYDITNDGQHIAVFGRDTPMSIYDIVPGCGRDVPFTTGGGNLNQGLETPCPELTVGSPLGDTANNTYMPRLQMATQPKFSEDGGELTFYATSYDNSIPPRRITLRARSYTPTQSLDYLALGDSYSSGEGDIDPNGVNYYRPLTDIVENKDKSIPQEKCHLSTRSYPYKLAMGMNLSISAPKQWESVACSGAEINDIDNPSIYSGQGARLNGYDVTGLKAQALNEFIPGREKQIEFVKKYKPKVITLTIGGNDTGFGEKIKLCASNITTCDYANSAKSNLASDISNQYENLKNLYTDLYNASGKKAKIYVLSYPQFINGSGSAICGVNVAGINSSEREMISNSVTYLNNVIKQATRAAGVKYIDIENSLDGHRICDNDEKYVDAAVFRVGSNGFTDYGSFHPNAKGHQAMADSVWNEKNVNHTNLLSYNVCQANNDAICPDQTITNKTIDVPSYFSDVTWKNSFYKELTPFEHVVNGTVDISIGAYTLAANTIATITGHSDPVSLGQYTVASDGSLTASLKLPSAMEVGFHRINVSGWSYSGDPIEFEQTILIKGSNPNDVDADGILDNQDKCLFISPSNQDYDGDGVDDACDPGIGDKPVVPSPSPSPKPSTTPISPSPTPSTTPTPKPIQISLLATLISAVKYILITIVIIVVKAVFKF